MRRPDYRRFSQALIALPAALALAACGSQGGAPVDQATGSGEELPPGAALPLSIGSAAQEEGDDPFANAVNCAASLDLTAERLAQMSSGPVSREINLMEQAESWFEGRAQDASDAASNSVSSAQAAIARRRREKVDDRTGQAQLAIACLRRYGEEVG